MPFVVRWPGVTKPGSVCPQLAHHADLLATLAEIWSAKLPDTAGEDSFSLLPLLRGGAEPTRPNAVSCSSGGIPGLRDGPWKLVLQDTPQLFNLDDDLGEQHNLAAEQPDRVQGMRKMMEEIITMGRSTPGTPQANDVEVRRHISAKAGKRL